MKLCVTYQIKLLRYVIWKLNFVYADSLPGIQFSRKLIISKLHW